MHIIERMIQYIAFRLNVLHQPPNRLDRQHRLVSERIDLLTTHKRDLLELELV